MTPLFSCFAEMHEQLGFVWLLTEPLVEEGPPTLFCCLALSKILSRSGDERWFTVFKASPLEFLSSGPFVFAELWSRLVVGLTCSYGLSIWVFCFTFLIWQVWFQYLCAGTCFLTFALCENTFAPLCAVQHLLGLKSCRWCLYSLRGELVWLSIKLLYVCKPFPQRGRIS